MPNTALRDADRVTGYPNLTVEEYFAPWRYAGQRPFNSSIDGMDTRSAIILGAILGTFAGLFLAALSFVSSAHGMDIENDWADTPPEVSAWFNNLHQPDYPRVSCCGEADFYWSDSYTSCEAAGFETGPECSVVAIVTDDRPDEIGSRKRAHVPTGTAVPVPPYKVKVDQETAGNPTGHGGVFYDPNYGANLDRKGWVYCYIMPGGV